MKGWQVGLVIIIILYILSQNNPKSGFTTKKISTDELNEKANEIYKNRKYFNDYYTAKRKIPWMDVVTYENIRRLKIVTLDTIKTSITAELA